MKTTIITIANTMVVLTLVFIAFNAFTSITAVEASTSYCEEGQVNLSLCIPKLETPTLTQPTLQTSPTLTQPKLETPTLTQPKLETPTLTQPKLEIPIIHPPVLEVKTCELKVSQNKVTVGDSVTLYWSVSGFTQVKINGELVSGASGSKVITNITERTVFVLEATDGKGSNCTQQVIVDCELPPPPPVHKECTLKLNKSVDKTSAKTGENLTYTITIENIGDADCTGGGVKIEDKVDSNINYISHQITSNLTAGYFGPVYTESDRTLRFNGNTLNPGEKGTITWVGKIQTPSQCGDFEVKNQAKATALELNNFKNWAYSQIVKTLVDNDCPPKPCVLTVGKTVDKTNANVGDYLTYTITVKNTGTADCTGGGVKIQDVLDTNIQYVEHTLTSNIGAGYINTPVYTSADRTLHFNGYVLEPGETGEIIVKTKVLTPAQCGDFEVKNKAKATAVELNNFNDWSYSPLVTTSIDNDCIVEDKYAEVIAHKIVCTDESELPNYGNGGPNITSTSALDWVNSHASCSFASGWEFEWTNDQSNNPADDYVGRAGGPWQTFGVTGADGKTSVKINLSQLTNNRVWFREVLKSGYISFTHGLNGKTNVDDFSAEMYCHTDVNNYDNRDYIEGMVDKVTYYCVAWNHKVVDETMPVCEVFTANPSQLPIGGGNVTLNWKVTDASEVIIEPTVGIVGLTGTRVLPITQSTTFKLTAKDVNGKEVSCNAPVTVPDTVPFTCGDNVTFTASNSSITRGSSVDLNWSTTDVDSVSISVINSTSLSGSQRVSPTSDTTYVLKATKGNVSIDCPVSITVRSGGGGGGSPTPRCDLEISKSKIKLGEEVTLTWDTSNAREVTIRDDRNRVVFTTADYLADKKRDFYDGSIKIKPTRDTRFTLTAESGSRDRKCSVDVEIDDSVVVLQTRDQQPLVAGISLTQVPYTGFEAGPIMTILFYLLLVAWALYITYVLVIRKQLVMASSDEPIMDVPTISVYGHNAMQKALETRPDAFVASVSTAPTANSIPTNLPTGNQIIGYENYIDSEVFVNPHQVSDVIVTELENRAHKQKALLSSDAVRHFIATTEGSLERHEALDEVISEAKKAYPLEDGWVVINESKMANLCEVCTENKKDLSAKSFVPATVPEGTGSLAEAIVIGNVIAAYEMIGHRPMFALADAAADLDAIYRNRKGANVKVSDLLIKETKSLSDEQIKNMITALAGALDGTYTDEASAVKVAIMKAIREVS